jgi:hypothetical protein
MVLAPLEFFLVLFASDMGSFWHIANL